MSYDYYLFNTVEPMYTLSEFDHEKLTDFYDWETVKESIATVIPDITWRDGEGSTYGTSPSVPGRFEIVIPYRLIEKNVGSSCGFFSVAGSFRTDQSEIVRQIARAIDFTVIDMQKNECLNKQSAFA